MGAGEVKLLAIKEIVPGDNPRQEFDEVALSELMQSMKHSGLLSPIGVRKLPSGKFKLVFGHRRMLAADRLGWEKIEAIEIPVDDEKDALIKTSTENVIRENVSLPEQGRVFTALLKKGLTSEQIAVRMGCSKKFVLKALSAFQHIPKKFHDRISYGTRGQIDNKGQIPATVALNAADIGQHNKLSEDQVGKLMEWAAKHNTNAIKMRTVGKLISEGVPMKEATKSVEFMKVVSLNMTMKIDVIKRLQNKYEMTIHDILYKYLEANDEFDLIPARVAALSEKSPPELVRKRKISRRAR
jgi:ParB/RepB/Spo0J family partition protein